VTCDVVGWKSVEFGNAVCDYGSFVVANVPRKLLSDHHELIIGARRGSPADLWKAAEASDNTLVLGAK